MRTNDKITVSKHAHRVALGHQRKYLIHLQIYDESRSQEIARATNKKFRNRVNPRVFCMRFYIHIASESDNRTRVP